MRENELKEWIGEFTARVKNAFGERIYFIGIQGSRARGEAGEESDIDMVVILNEFTYNDLIAYREAIADIPNRDKLCGFISGKEELINWDRADLFQFCHDTLPISGNLEEIKALISPLDISRAVHLGACNIYHSCVHNAIHEKSLQTLSEIIKSAYFLLMAKHYLESGEYISGKSRLKERLEGRDVEVLSAEEYIDLKETSALLMDWAADIIKSYGEN
ncbi:MAG: nucleotidyltransferase domain-containing protein [Eubacteriaceae bacterium]|nr:nucleotidyltransferase domain-containing protein [Eubacteriaceae bacterium]